MEQVAGAPRAPIRWYERLHVRFALLQGLLLLLVISTTITVMFTVERSLFLDQGYALATQLGNRVVATLGQRVAATETLTATLARLGESLRGDAEAVQRVVPAVLDGADLRATVAGGGLWPEPGAFSPGVARRSFFWGRDATDALQYFDDYNDAHGPGYHQEEWYVPARYLAPGEAYWSRSYIDPYSDEPMVTCTAPMFRDGVFTGTATVDLRLQGLADFLAQAARVTGGYIFAVDRNQRFIAHSRPGTVRSQASGADGARDFPQVGAMAGESGFYASIQEALLRENTALMETAIAESRWDGDLAARLAEESYQLETTEATAIARFLATPRYAGSSGNLERQRIFLDNDPLLGEPVMASLFHVPVSDWWVVVVTPVSSFYAVADAATWEVARYVIGLELVAFMVMFWVMRSFLFRPIRRMSRAVWKLSRSDTPLTARLDDGSRDELGELAHQFNQRSDHLLAALDGVKRSNEALNRQVTEREAAERAMREAKEDAERAAAAKGAFLANMSHELRTPLNGILGYTQILQRDMDLSPRQREGVKIIHRSGDYLLTLINDVLDLAKIEAGRIEIHPADFQFPAFLEGLVELFQMRAAQKDIAFNFQALGPIPAVVHGDERRLRQVLINLLGNALKFTEQGGVSFRVEYRQGQALFQVDDTGPGIAEEELTRIFQPFHQSGTRNQRAEGTGLGLAISRRLVEAMGSRVAVQSTVGKGSAFMVKLSLPEGGEDALGERPVAPVVVGYQGPRRRVLVIDDRWENRSVIRHLLEPLGFQVSEAADGEVGLTVVAEQRPDIILTDLVMPVMDGFEIVRRLRADPRWATIPVVAVSASVFEQDREASRAVGCDAFVPKPVRLDALLEALHDLLALDWQLSRGATIAERSTPASPTVTPSSILGPTRTATLEELALHGDVAAILEILETYRAEDPALGPLLDELQMLAEDFQVEEIAERMREDRAAEGADD